MRRPRLDVVHGFRRTQAVQDLRPIRRQWAVVEGERWPALTPMGTARMAQAMGAPAVTSLRRNPSCCRLIQMKQIVYSQSVLRTWRRFSTG